MGNRRLTAVATGLAGNVRRVVNLVIALALGQHHQAAGPPARSIANMLLGLYCRGGPDGLVMLAQSQAMTRLTTPANVPASRSRRAGQPPISTFRQNRAKAQLQCANNRLTEAMNCIPA